MICFFNVRSPGTDFRISWISWDCHTRLEAEVHREVVIAQEPFTAWYRLEPAYAPSMAIEMAAYLPAAHELHQAAGTERELEKLLLRGFSHEAVDGLSTLGLQDPEIALYVAAPKADVLSSEDSKGALRAAYVVLRAIEVFGSREKAYTWLRESNERLDKRSPLQVAHSEAGVGHIERLLIHVEEGEGV